MHRERLKRLAEILDAVPPAQFDLGFWYTKTDCGTIACAGGWAALDPGFQADGLKPDAGMPTYAGERGFAALIRFFGLSSVTLFMPYGYPLHRYPGRIRPADVAARVRELLEAA